VKQQAQAGRLATFATAGAMALCGSAIPISPAHAQLALDQIYLGWDFGNGFGIGVGRVPSSYNPCPTYGWPIYPNNCMAAAPAAVVR
jgi:hypothetical protein